MAYLIFPPPPTGAHPYAILNPDAADEIVIRDLQRWGWRVEIHDATDAHFVSGLGNMDGEGDSRGQLWAEWTREVESRAKTGDAGMTQSEEEQKGSWLRRWRGKECKGGIWLKKTFGVICERGVRLERGADAGWC